MLEEQENNNIDDVEKLIPDIMEDENIPAEQKKKLVRVMKSFQFSAHGIMPAPNPLAEKMTPELIELQIKNIDKDSERDYNDRQNTRWFIFGGTLVGLIFLTFIIITLKDNSEMFKIVIPPMIAAVLGAFGGYGYGKSKNLD